MNDTKTIWYPEYWCPYCMSRYTDTDNPIEVPLGAEVVMDMRIGDGAPAAAVFGGYGTASMTKFHKCSDSEVGVLNLIGFVKRDISPAAKRPFGISNIINRLCGSHS